jgi:enterochelin esterase-like enzyme
MTSLPPLRTLLVIPLLLGASACSAFDQPVVTPTEIPSTLTPIPAPTPTPTIIPTATPLGCLTQPGQLESGSINTTNPVQEFLVYVPPCYDVRTDLRYPVIYLLHGQLQTDDYWPLHVGTVAVADAMIHSGASVPFIMVFPDDRYWNQPPEAGFGDRVINLVIPYIDRNFRTIADRDHRAIGGLSSGGGWALYLGLVHYDLFGSIGLHSPAIRPEDEPYIPRWINAIPTDSWPRIWIDAGDRDKDLSSISQFDNLLTEDNVTHDFHLFAGDHSEGYWAAHADQYLQWYADAWNEGTPTPAP